MSTRHWIGPLLALLLPLLPGQTAFAVDPPLAGPPQPAPPVAQPSAPQPGTPERHFRQPSTQTPAPLPPPTTGSAATPRFPDAPSAPDEQPFIIDLKEKRQQAEQRFDGQMRERRAAFVQRQKEEEEDFTASMEDRGFWERRRLIREFKAKQRLERRTFNTADDARRKKTEWRFE